MRALSFRVVALWSLVGCDGTAWDEPVGLAGAALSGTLENQTPFANPTGASATFSLSGDIDLGGPFFTAGANGRSCASCHEPSAGWTITPATVEARFDATDGTDPLFAHDGQNCEGADRSTPKARKAASSLMLSRAVVRLDRPIPPDGELELVAWEGTYCNRVDPTQLVLFRRPRPTTNLTGIPGLLWDGFFAADPVDDQLRTAGILASVFHMQDAPPPAERVDALVELMRSLSTAQVYDVAAGDLMARGALGGPEHLAFLPAGGEPGFRLYEAWRTASASDPRSIAAARNAVRRGEVTFNARCAGCHSAPDRGHGATLRFFDVGISDVARRTPDMPLYTFRNKATGETIQTTDPGRALVTGLWDDLGHFAVPSLRGLAARPPYFHDGSAATLADVVHHYDMRFGLGLTKQERGDLAQFLAAL